MIYAPVCGCNGVTYSNNCIAINFGGVLSYTDGPCTGACLDMSQFDFGDCDLFLGYAWTPDGCEAFSGCGWTYCNVNYQSQFFDSPESCQSQCPSVDSTCISQTQIEQGFLVDCSPFDNNQVCGCNNVTYQNSCHAYYVGGVTSYASGACGNNGCRGVPYEVNFGFCAMQLGFVRLPSGCISISGCSFIGSNGYDYSDFFFTSESDCNMGCAEVVCVDSSLIDPSVMCPAIYDPVCGCNGLTYSNECEATYYGGVTSWVAGECGSACFNPDLVNPDAICPTVIAPVCGCDGNTYENSCYAEIAGITSWTNGACNSVDCIDSSLIDPSMGCFQVYNPVCGCDGVTYSNDCYATYYGGVTSWVAGECGSACFNPDLVNPDTICPTVIAPVCGCDGNTYENSCYAEIAGITSWTNGACGSGCIDSSLIDLTAICPLVYDPVCGCDGITYDNYCYAQYYGGVISYTDGACGGVDCVDPSLINLDVICPAVINPVCGCNGITYNNDCEATNYGGVTSWVFGSCSASCDVFCVTNIFFDTTGTLQAEIQFNGQPTEFINYPYVTSILDGSGQIVATGDMWVFGQIGGTSETYPLTSTVLANPLPENFNATV
ncbi:MAG: Kazal-type serine protease inhibitor domain-containing protein, partial [Flavobacteriales bacterium]